MTPEQARIYNKAIDDALLLYNTGPEAINALKKKIIITVEHVGRSTKQDVKVEE